MALNYNLVNNMSYILDITTGEYLLLLDGAVVGRVKSEDLALTLVELYNKNH